MKIPFRQKRYFLTELYKHVPCVTFFNVKFKIPMIQYLPGLLLQWVGTRWDLGGNVGGGAAV
jgi:hypothetical protein